MPPSYTHTENRKSFLAVKKSRSPLLRAYGLLVVIELALKDYIYQQKNKWIAGHDIEGLINIYINFLPNTQPPLSTLSVQLGNELQKLCCSDKNRQPNVVDRKNYPHIRYLRFDSDFETSNKEKLCLNRVYYIASEIVNELKKNYVI